MSRVSLSTDGSFSGSIQSHENLQAHRGAFVLLHRVSSRRHKLEWIGYIEECVYDHHNEKWHLSGHVVGVVPEGSPAEVSPFVAPNDDCSGDATISKRPDDILAALSNFLPSRSPCVEIGWLARPEGSGCLAKISLEGLSRHAAVFGQSGSGKTNALAVLLEQIHIHGEADIVVLDPNGDFVKFADPVRIFEDLDPKEQASLAAGTKEAEWRKWYGAAVTHHESKKDESDPAALTWNSTRSRLRFRVHRADSLLDPKAPGVRPTDFNENEIAAFLDLHPLTSGVQYGRFMEAIGLARDRTKQYTWEDVERELTGGEDQRAEDKKVDDNLKQLMAFHGLRKKGLWHEESVTAALSAAEQDANWCYRTVFDLSGLDREEQGIITVAVCRALWNMQDNRRKRADKGGASAIVRPTYLFVDEAQNIFPADGDAPYERLGRKWGTRIAAEGRKNGLYLVVCSQLPSKLEPRIISECGNLVLMRMLSQTDIDQVGQALSYVKESLLEVSKTFSAGEALVIGDVLRCPAIVRFMPRLTHGVPDAFKLKQLRARE